MNEPSSYTNIPVAPTAQPVIEPTLLPEKQQGPPHSTNSPVNDADDDDSTIKCICGFKHDDGNSVFCEKCETWQHTECYYYDVENDRVPTKDELEKISHFCTDCRPRSINVHAAIARQKARIGGFDQDDRKAKKTASKSHKKKTRPELNGVLTNGWPSDGDGVHDRTSRSPRESTSGGKRPKNQHRSSQSMGVPSVPQNLTSHPHKRSASALQSPTKAAAKHGTHHTVKELYSETFLHLYDNDPGEQNLRTNTFSNISITRDLSDWAVDVDALNKATRGFSHADVFHRIEQPLENIMGSPPLKQTREDVGVLIDGRHPRWICLTSEGYTKKNTIVDELKGKIGHMTDYISDPENRWDYLRHPAPFVFFHPKLPIYIDTRSLGTTCRYLRRSCRPNLSMTTFLENDSEYHFCFTAKEDIGPGSEYTIGWTLDEHMRKFSSNKNDMAQDLSPDGEEYFTDWVGKVSPEFGGCACGLPDTCWLVRYDPEFRQAPRAKGGRSGRKVQHTAHDSSDADEGGASSPSNAGSRALTPVGAGLSTNALGLDISERDKRKIALLEKTGDNDKYQPATKKKKRNSGGASANPSGASSTPKPSAPIPSSISLPNTPGFPPKPQYSDASTSARKSGSPSGKVVNGLGRSRNSHATAKQRWSQPNTPTNPSPLRSNYVSVAVQTEPDPEGDWVQAARIISNPLKKPFMSMTKRLLLRSQRDRQLREDHRQSLGSKGSQGSPEIPSGTVDDEKTSRSDQADVEMTDSHGAELNVVGDAATELPDPPSSTNETVPNAWSSGGEMTPSVNGDQQIDLRLTLAPKPSQMTDFAPEIPTTQSPMATTPHSLPSRSNTSQNPTFPLPLPGSATVQPSPVKKKVSLSDYIKRKGSHHSDGRTTHAGSPESPHRALKSSLPVPKDEQGFHDNAIVDTPKREEDDPLHSEPGGPTPAMSMAEVKEKVS